MNTMQFDNRRAIKFAKAYNEARRCDMKTFIFGGQEFVLEYAYYLIQHFVNNKLISGEFSPNKIFSNAKDN